MDIYKIASKEGIRFLTSKGQLTVEQLWTLSLPELDALAVSLERKSNASVRKSFLTEVSTKEENKAKLMFDIVYDILTTIQKEAQDSLAAFEQKRKTDNILRLIAEKKEESLKGKTIEELEAMLVS